MDYLCRTCDARLPHQGSHQNPVTGAPCGGRPDYEGTISNGDGLRAPAWSQPPRWYYIVAARIGEGPGRLYLAYDDSLTMDRGKARPYEVAQEARGAADALQARDDPEQTRWTVYSCKASPEHEWGCTNDGETRCIDCDCRPGGRASKEDCGAYEPPAAAPTHQAAVAGVP